MSEGLMSYETSTAAASKQLGWWQLKANPPVSVRSPVYRQRATSAFRHLSPHRACASHSSSSQVLEMLGSEKMMSNLSVAGLW